MKVYAAFFDESGTHHGSSVTSFAGYIFADDQIPHFDREWQRLLDENALPYFHMSDCAHGAGHFAELSKVDRTEIARKAIGIIKRRTRMGISVVMQESEYLAAFPEPEFAKYLSVYTLCAQVALIAVGRWADRVGHDEPIRYVFEAGAAKQTELGAYLSRITTGPMDAWRTAFRMQRFEFAGKTSETMLQAADLLAWQACKHMNRYLEGKGTRMDFHSLREHPHELLQLSDELLREWREKLMPGFLRWKEHYQQAPPD